MIPRRTQIVIAAAACGAVTAVGAASFLNDGKSDLGDQSGRATVRTVVVEGSFEHDFTDPRVLAGTVDAIVVGRIVAERATLPAGDGAPYPRRSFVVDPTQILMGDVKKNDELSILQPGG